MSIEELPIVYEHNFQRDRVDRNHFCYICHEKWDQDQVKYYRCTICSLSVHSTCRSMAKRCQGCNSSVVLKRYNDQDIQTILNTVNKYSGITYNSGQLYVKLLHVYDLPNLASGTTLYGFAKTLKNGDESIRFGSSKLDDELNCVWKSDNDKLHDNSNEQYLVATYDSAGKNKLYLEIWRSALGIFDDMCAVADVSLIPLYLNPNTVVERLFSLHNLNRQPCGMALVRFLYVPFDETTMHLKRAPKPTILSSIENMVIQLTDNTEESFDAADSQSGAITSSSILDAVTASSAVTEESIKSSNENKSASNLAAITSLLSITAETIDKFAQDLVTVDENTPAKLPAAPVEDEDEFVDSATPSIDENDGNNQVESVQEFVDTAEPADEKRTYHVIDDITTDRTPSKQERSVGSDPMQQSEDAMDPILPRNEVVVMETPTKSHAVTSASPSTPFAQWAQNTFEKLIFDPTTTQANSVVPPQHNVVVPTTTNVPVNTVNKPVSVVTSKSAKMITKKIMKANSLEAGVPLTAGVGRIFIHLMQVTKHNVNDTAEGDHYVLLTLEDTDYEERSQRIISSATPVFDIKRVMIAPHYRALLRIYLVDASTDRKVAVATTSPYALMQRDADKYSSDWTKVPFENVPMHDLQDDKVEIGYLSVKIQFEEDITSLFLSSMPRIASNSPDEVLSVERLSQHIERFKALIAFGNDCFAEYCYIMDWENVALTLTLLIVFLIMVFRVDAEYALCCPLFLLVILMTRSLLRRRNGLYRKKWIEKGIDNLPDSASVSVLRIAVCDYRNITYNFQENRLLSAITNTQQSIRNPYVKLSLVLPAKSSAVPINDVKGLKNERRELVIGTICGDSIGTGIGGIVGAGIGGISSVTNKALATTGPLSTIITSLNSIIRNEPQSKENVLQNILDPWPAAEAGKEGREIPVHTSFVYPILQPYVETTMIKVDDNDQFLNSNEEEEEEERRRGGKQAQQAPSKPISLLPWSQNESIIKLSLFEKNPSALLDTFIGTVNVKLNTLLTTNGSDKNLNSAFKAGIQEEVSGWFDIVPSKAAGEADSFNLSSVSHDTVSSESSNVRGTDKKAQVYLRMQLDIYDEDNGSNPDRVVDRQELSIILHDVLSIKDDKTASTISNLWNFRDNIRFVQNLMGWILDRYCFYSLTHSLTHSLTYLFTPLVLKVSRIYFIGRRQARPGRSTSAWC